MTYTRGVGIQEKHTRSCLSPGTSLPSIENAKSASEVEHSQSSASKLMVCHEFTHAVVLIPHMSTVWPLVRFEMILCISVNLSTEMT